MTDARTITRELRGVWYKSYGLAFCPAHGNALTPALSLKDARDGRLLAHCHAGCTFSEIIATLRARGLVGCMRDVVAPDPIVDAQRRAEERAEAEKRAKQALWCWEESEPIKGTLGETYLRARGITCDLPESLAFSSECWHLSAKKIPAIVSRVDGCERFAIHRTYLSAAAEKASVEPNKTMLGSVAGGAVRLSGDAGPLVIAEGIETGLSLLSGMLGHPARVWAALTTSGISGLNLPCETGDLIIAADGDEPGRKAAHSLAERAARLGWNVSTINPPDGQDFNDVLIGRAAA